MQRPGMAAAALAIGACLAPTPARAYFERTEVGARGIAMGRTFSAIADDVSAIYWNPAGLTALETPEAFVTHYRPFVVEDVALNFAALAWPTRQGTVWGAWSRFGLSGVMSEDLFYVGAARRFRWTEERAVSVGANLKVARVAFQEQAATGAGQLLDLGSEADVGADVGVLLRWNPKLTLAYVVRNVGEPSFDFVPGNGRTVLEMRHEAGAAYRWNPESTLSVALVENSQGDVGLVAGGEITFYESFRLRAGAGDLKFYGGVGVKTDLLRLDAAFITHNTLGVSTMISLAIPFGGDE